MANECAGTWVSQMIFDKVTQVPLPIGSVVIEEHDTRPGIKGFLVGMGSPQELQNGTCTRVPAAGTATHHILRFRVKVSGEMFEFRGLVRAASPNVISCGTFRSLGGGGPDEGDTGTWEATKGGLLTGEGGKGKPRGAGKKAAKRGE